MKVLLCHAYYTQRGGEDQSFEDERALLVSGGHRVVEYVRRNDDLVNQGAASRLGATLWNRRAARDIADLIDRESPDVLHSTNTFPSISPAVCRVAYDRGVAVVQALRNYRLLCAGAYLMRDGRPCEDCIGRAIPWPAVVHRCYRQSAAASAAVGAMQTLHRATGTWRRKVDAFFTLTEFARQKFVEAGFPAERVHVKYNSVQPEPAPGDGSGGYAAFVGRLSPEKGVATLLEAWRKDAGLPPLKIAGDGPLAPLVRDAALQDQRIEFLGTLPAERVLRVLASARVLVAPSVWYETFGRTIAEAFAVGTPVVASRLGAMDELVVDGKTGWKFAPGDSADLAAKVRCTLEASPAVAAKLRQDARGEYESRFTPQQNYRRLLEIYQTALRRASARRAAPSGRSNGAACDSPAVREAVAQ